MKYIYLLTVLLLAQTFYGQDNLTTTNWEEAQKLAETNDKDILIVMTGSEWCATSRDMKKRVLQSDDFSAYTSSNAVTFIIDIANEGCEGNDKEIQTYQKFSDMYETEAFPAMVLVKSDGEKIKEIDGKLYKRKNVMQQLHSEAASTL